MVLNFDRCTCGMGCGLQWPLRVFHTELQAWEPKLLGKTNTKYMTESMILERETWAGGGEIRKPCLPLRVKHCPPQQLNQLPSLPKQNTSTLEPFLYVTSHLTGRFT
jgi:hypothetical protein